MPATPRTRCSRRFATEGSRDEDFSPVSGTLAGVVLSLTPAARAHHSFAAEFDGKNCRDFTGVLTKLDWQNPHAYFYVDVKEADGQVESWSFQTYALITLRRAGNDRQLFLDNVGKEVFVRGCVARNGRKNYAAAGTHEILGWRAASGRSATGLKEHTECVTLALLTGAVGRHV